MRHQWRSSGVRVIFRSQPGPTIAHHEELQGTARRELCSRGTVCVPGWVRPGFHGVCQAQTHRWVGHWVKMYYIILMYDRFGEEHRSPTAGLPVETGGISDIWLRAYASHRTGSLSAVQSVLVHMTPATCVFLMSWSQLDHPWHVTSCLASG